jgi:hypothetical protein
VWLVPARLSGLLEDVAEVLVGAMTAAATRAEAAIPTFVRERIRSPLRVWSFVTFPP